MISKACKKYLSDLLKASHLSKAATAIGLAALMNAVPAQTMGIATMQPGTISHTTASALAKVLTEQAGIQMLVQPTAGETVAIAMVAKGEAQFGLANTPELSTAVRAGHADSLRLIGPVHPLRVAFFVRKDSPMKTVADLRGKRVAMGYSSMRVIDSVSRAILATGGLTESDIQPVPVSNILSSADDFAAGSADTFYFAFGSPKVREVDSSVGGVRALEIPQVPGIDGAKSVLPYGYLTEVAPSQAAVGISQPIRVYTFDNLLFANASVPDSVIYKVLDILLANGSSLTAIQPAMREFSPARLYLSYDIPYHPGALKYFREKAIAQGSVN
jgi:uncharacterized protein